MVNFLIGFAIRQAIICTYNYFYDKSQSELMY